MKKYIVIRILSLSLFLGACDHFLNVVPKGKSVLNTTSDYLGLIEELDPN